MCDDYLLYRSIFLKIPVYLTANDEFLMTDAKSSRWLQEKEKNIKLFKTKPVTNFLQQKFHPLVNNCNQFWTEILSVLSVQHFYIINKKIQQIGGSEFSSYETELRKKTSHFELLTRKFYRNSSFELLTRRLDFYFSTFELLTRSWKIKSFTLSY